MPEPIEDARRAFTAYTVERELGSGGMATVYLANEYHRGEVYVRHVVTHQDYDKLTRADEL